MTRINVVPVTELTDQHLMAEYRELPMVPAIALRSKIETYKPTMMYTLNKGHVMFFYNKKKFLLNRWLELIAELSDRGYKIDPVARIVQWPNMDKFPQVDWVPDSHAISINQQRLDERIAQKPHWYRFRGKPIC